MVHITAATDGDDDVELRSRSTVTQQSQPLRRFFHKRHTSMAGGHRRACMHAESGDVRMRRRRRRWRRIV
jgi:hypothetical protein